MEYLSAKKVNHGREYKYGCDDSKYNIASAQSINAKKHGGQVRIWRIDNLPEMIQSFCASCGTILCRLDGELEFVLTGENAREPPLGYEGSEVR